MTVICFLLGHAHLAKLSFAPKRVPKSNLGTRSEVLGYFQCVGAARCVTV